MPRRLLLDLVAAPALVFACAFAPLRAHDPPDRSPATSSSSHLEAATRVVRQVESAVADPTLAAPARLDALIDGLYRYTLITSPEAATFWGESTGLDRWTDTSPEAAARRRTEIARWARALASIDRGALDPRRALDAEVLARRLDDAVAGYRFPSELLPVSQLEGLHQTAPEVLAAMPAEGADDHETILARLAALPHAITAERRRLERGLERGVTPPALTLRDVPEQLAALTPPEPLASPLLAPFRNRPAAIDERTWERLRRAASELFETRIHPAFSEHRRFLVERYLPGARSSLAMTAIPDGAAWYAHLVRLHTTTDRTPDEIERLGRSEVERIEGLLVDVAAEFGVDGPLAALHQRMRTDPAYRFTDTATMLSAYRDAAKRADGALPALFGRLPRLPYGVAPMPQRIAVGAPAAYYRAGSPAAARAGTFLVNASDLPSRPAWRVEPLTLHEAVPGHHLESALAQENDDLPWFRRQARWTAFSEGWALYAESLGAAMGFYRDPASRYGALTSELWRALRLVADTGLHFHGWDRERTIAYLSEHSGRRRSEIETEVDRYVAWPAQALAYKVGELRIRALRAEAEAALGAAFDLRAFHDAVLSGGSLPLDILERRIRAWIAARAAA